MPILENMWRTANKNPCNIKQGKTSFPATKNTKRFLGKWEEKICTLYFGFIGIPTLFFMHDVKYGINRNIF